MPGTARGTVDPEVIRLQTGAQQDETVSVTVPARPDVAAIDLALAELDTAGLTMDAQTLAVDGTVDVFFENLGSGAYEGSLAGAIEIAVFEDRNASGAFEPGADNLLGTTRYADDLPAGGQVPSPWPFPV